MAPEIEAVDRAFGPGDGGIVHPRSPGYVLEHPLLQVGAQELEE